MSRANALWARAQFGRLHGWGYARRELLEAIASDSDYRGIVCCSVAQLAERIGRSTREAQRLLNDLQAAGLLERSFQFTSRGRQLVNAFRLLLEQVAEDLPRMPSILRSWINELGGCFHNREAPPCEGCAANERARLAFSSQR